MERLKTFLLIVMVMAVTFSASAQSECLKVINDQVWAPFTKAYETHDADLFGSIHHSEFIRASGGTKSLEFKESYIDGYVRRWANPRGKQTISFRFLERFCNEETASERGIYKLTIGPGTENERSFYGKFHVILKKENGNWRLLVDYDSSEGNTINAASYEEAFAIDDLEKY